MAVIRILRNTPEEIERRGLKKEAATRNKQKKENSKAKAAAEGPQRQEEGPQRREVLVLEERDRKLLAD